MKHIKIFYGIFTILLATLTFTGCTSDNDNEHTNPDIPREIVGNWIYDDSREPEIYSFKKMAMSFFNRHILIMTTSGF